MVTRITLGNLVSQDGQTKLVGSQSGLDTAAIVKGLTEAKRLPAVRLEEKNEKLASEASALKELKSILTRFKASADALRNPPGVNNSSSNIFEYRKAALTATNGFSAANYVGITVEPGASVQSFNITNIQQLARETRQETNTISLTDSTTASAVTAAPTAGRFTAGTFSLRVLDGGADASITLANGDSLQSVANKFNEVSNRTGIRANVIKVANGSPNSDYKIIFTATKTGVANGFDLTNPTTVTSDPSSVFAQVGIPAPSQTAQDARFFIDGIQIDRDSNSIDDVFNGVTFNLLQANAGATSINVKVQPDTEIVGNAITGFVDIYNEFRLFAAKQTELGEDGLPVEGALLNNNNTLRTIISQVGAEVARVVDGINSGPNRLADIGLGFDDFEGDEENPFTRNILTIDTEKLTSSLSADFDGVRSLFEYQLTADNAALTTFKRSNTLNETAFTLNIDRTNNVYQATYLDDNLVSQTINLDFNTITGGGVTLTGQSGTVLEGLQLIYANTGDATINVGVTQGIGDRAFNMLENMLDDEEGLLSVAIANLEEQQTNNEEEITKIDEQIETYRGQLEAQYAALEEALSKANNLLTLLNAQSDARANA